jgi:hypothetical protein
MPGCLDASVPGCLETWKPGNLDAGMPALGRYVCEYPKVIWRSAMAAGQFVLMWDPSKLDVSLAPRRIVSDDWRQHVGFVFSC